MRFVTIIFKNILQGGYFNSINAIDIWEGALYNGLLHGLMVLMVNLYHLNVKSITYII